MLADTIVAAALSYTGCSWGDPATRERYCKHMCPGDTPANARQMGSRQSACLLHCKAVLGEQRRGDGSPELDGTIMWKGRPVDLWTAPYAGPLLGTIEGLLFELGRQRGVLKTRLYEGEAVPDLHPGDIVLVGQGGGAPSDPAAKAKWLAEWGGVAHGFVVTAVSPDGLTVESSDGGQSDKLNSGYPTAIAKVQRVLVRRPQGWFLGSRRLSWRLRAPDLPLAQSAAAA